MGTLIRIDHNGTYCIVVCITYFRVNAAAVGRRVHLHARGIRRPVRLYDLLLSAVSGANVSHRNGRYHIRKICSLSVVSGVRAAWCSPKNRGNSYYWYHTTSNCTMFSISVSNNIENILNNETSINWQYFCLKIHFSAVSQALVQTINAYDVRITSSTVDLFTVTKLGALVMICLGGAWIGV